MHQLFCVMRTDNNKTKVYQAPAFKFSRRLNVN